MITIGQEQQLGRKAFYILLSRRTTTAFVLFIVSAAILALNVSLSTGIAGIMAIGGSVRGSTVSAVSGIISYIDTAVFLGSIILFLLGFIISLLQYRNQVFVFDEFGIKIRRGILSQKEISIPYRQIQDVDIVRSASHRLFGVSRLAMITAGNDSDDAGHDQTDGVFDPIDQGLAEEMRAFLERRIGVQIVEGTAQADTESH